MAQNGGRLEKSLKVLTADEAARDERAYWLSLTPNERLRMLAELRQLWGPENGQRLKRVLEIIEVP